MADQIPVNHYQIVHLPGFPCGASHGRYGAGWGPITCSGCKNVRR